MTSLVLCMALLTAVQDKDYSVTALEDGYVRVETKTYTIEVPKGWKVSNETPWGARKAAPNGDKGELGVMTAPPGQQSWDQLYDTSLYFIMREEKGTATPYKIVKTKAGLEAAEFGVTDSKGFLSRRYLLVKDPAKGLLALSVRIPGSDVEKQWAKHFKRLVDTAKFKD